MPTPERRQLHRTSMSRIACIHIEPDNGGIVLNVSREGLCFHSMTEVERNGSFHFALMEHNRRIDACGELVWTDATKKIGGVKFTTLPVEAREQIQNWIDPPQVLGGQVSSNSGRFFARLLPSLDTLKFRRKPEAGTLLSPVAPAKNFRVRLSGFNRGLLTGLLVSALAASALLSFRAYRGQLGESLIKLGERLAPGPRAPTQRMPTPAAASPVVSQKNVPPPVADAKPIVAQGKPVSSPRLGQDSIRPDSQQPRRDTFTNPDGDSGRERAVQLSSPRTATPLATNLRVRPDGVAQSALRSESPIPAVTPPKDLAIFDAGRPPQLTLTAPVPNAPEEEIFHPSMYFDLGKFKDELRAQDVSSRVTQLGMRASVVQKRFLWRNSFQVLVGPYRDENEASKIGKELSAHGYKSRPFERGSRNFIFGSGVILNGAELPVGDLTITWESYVNSAKVKFFQHDGLMASAEGRWVGQPRRYRHNEYVYERIGNGPRTLVEVHFSGMDRALVLRKHS